MPSPPLTRSWKLAIFLGSLIGLGLGYSFGTSLGGGLQMFTTLVGGLVGAISGLDALIPGPTPDQFEHEPRVGPFRAGALHMVLAIGGFVLAAYLWGTVTLHCEKKSNAVECVRSSNAWGGVGELERQVVSEIASFIVGNRDQIVTTSVQGERSFIEGFDSGAAEKLRLMLAGQLEQFTVESDTYKWGPPIVVLLSLLSLVMSLLGFRRGTQLMCERKS